MAEKRYRTVKGEPVTVLDIYRRETPKHLIRTVDDPVYTDYALVRLAPQSPGHRERFEHMRLDSLEVIK